MGLGNFVGNLTGGLIGESDAEKAAKKGSRLSQQTYQQIVEELKAALGLSEEDLQPYLQAGLQSLNEFMSYDLQAPELEMFNFNPDQLGSNPAYQWRYQQGLQATDRMQAKNRALTSGNRIAALTDYGQGAASQEYENEWQRQIGANTARNATRVQQYGLGADVRGSLFNAATMGQNAANTMAGLRTGTAANISNAATQNAANQFATNLIPVQEKGNFISGLMNLGGQFLGRR